MGDRKNGIGRFHALLEHSFRFNIFEYGIPCTTYHVYVTCANLHTVTILGLFQTLGFRDDAENGMTLVLLCQGT